MITPLTITSLDQGRELARRHVARLYAEPAEPAPVGSIENPEVAGAAVPSGQATLQPAGSRVARLLALWHQLMPIAAWRLRARHF